MVSAGKRRSQVGGRSYRPTRNETNAELSLRVGDVILERREYPPEQDTNKDASRGARVFCDPPKLADG